MEKSYATKFNAMRLCSWRSCWESVLLEGRCGLLRRTERTYHRSRIIRKTRITSKACGRVRMTVSITLTIRRRGILKRTKTRTLTRLATNRVIRAIKAIITRNSDSAMLGNLTHREKALQCVRFRVQFLANVRCNEQL